MINPAEPDGPKENSERARGERAPFPGRSPQSGRRRSRRAPRGVRRGMGGYARMDRGRDPWHREPQGARHGSRTRDMPDPPLTGVVRIRSSGVDPSRGRGGLDGIHATPVRFPATGGGEGSPWSAPTARGTGKHCRNRVRTRTGIMEAGAEGARPGPRMRTLRSHPLSPGGVPGRMGRHRTRGGTPIGGVPRVMFQFRVIATSLYPSHCGRSGT